MKWIKLKDEMPETCVDLLLQLKSNEIVTGWRSSCFRFTINDYEFPLNEVKAWMPLPLPELRSTEEDISTKHLSVRQFLGCFCDVLIEQDKTELPRYFIDFMSFVDTPLEKVFCKLYKDNIIIDFDYDDIFEIMKHDSGCFNFYGDKIAINPEYYAEQLKHFYLKDLNAEVEEKLKTYLKELNITVE